MGEGGGLWTKYRDVSKPKFGGVTDRPLAVVGELEELCVFSTGPKGSTTVVTDQGKSLRSDRELGCIRVLYSSLDWYFGCYRIVTGGRT